MPAAELGVVSLSVATNGILPYAYDEVGIVQVVGGKAGRSCTLKSVSADVSVLTTYFATRLPAGDYRFYRFGDYSISPSRIANAAEVSGSSYLGTFRVVAGQRSDLGRVIVNVPQYEIGLNPGSISFGLGRSARFPRNTNRQPFGADAHLLDFPDIAQPWANARNDQDTVEQTAMANPVGFGRPASMGNGVIAVPAGIGGLWLKNSAEWKHVPVDDGRAIVDVMPAGDAGASAVAVGELGLLALVDSSGKISPIDSGDLPLGRNVFLDGDAKAGWYLVQSVGFDISIYHSNKLMAGHWVKVGAEYGHWKAMNDAQSFWLWRGPSGFS
jgi:hypothetical protein